MSRGAGRASKMLEDAAKPEDVWTSPVDSQTPPRNRIRPHCHPHVLVRIPEYVLKHLEFRMRQYVRNFACNSRPLPEYFIEAEICFQIWFVSETASSCIDLHFLEEPVEGIDQRTFA